MEYMEAQSQDWLISTSFSLSQLKKPKIEMRSAYTRVHVFSRSLEQAGSQQNMKQFTNIKLVPFMSIPQIGILASGA